MPVAPVRLNPAVLFVADLDRSLRYYSDVFGMEMVTTDRGTAPRSSACPARATITTSASSAWAPARHPSLVAASASTTSRGSSTRSTNSPRPGRCCLLWMLPRQDWGVHENTASVEHLDRDAELSRWSGTRSAGRIVIDLAEHHSPAG